MLLSALLSVVLLCFSSYSNAQVSTNPGSGQTGDILILGNGWTGTVSQCTHNYDCWAGQSDQGDIHQGNDVSTGNGVTYYWSGTQQTLSNTIAINTALAASGIQVDGFDYEWVYKNGNANWFSGQPGGGAVDPLEIVVNVYDSNGNLFKSYRYDYGQNFSNWRTATGTETFGTSFLDPSFFGNVVVEVTAQDIAGQAGYWGPEFRAEQSGLYVNYSTNPCYNNPLFDPQCPGYANALFQQQCTSNPLFDPSCPGYAAAYLTQQCSANPLYDPACPGYANAYYNQQCQLDPLYDSGCTGYKTAYLNQQCSLDPLYDPSCPGYASANLAKQCDYDPLYSVECTGYQQAYLEQQCELDSLYDVQCPDYQTAIELAKIVDDGKTDDPTIINNEIDVTTTTEIEGLPNVLALPDVQTVVVEEIDDGEGFQEVEDNIRGDQLAMEDDIEKEIEELESQTGNTAMDDDIEKELAEVENEANSGDGNTNQEDDIEKELAELEESTSDDEDFQDPTQKTITEKPPEKKMGKKKEVVEKKSTKNDKIRMLLAQKAIELTKKIEQETNLENQMLVQRQLLALISYVPGFDYAEKKNKDNDFYPDKPTVDHAFARWFLNDPNFDTMENLQYPNLN